VTAGDLAVALLGVAALGLCAATVALWFQVRAATAELRRLIDSSAAAVDEARASAEAAQAEVARIEALLARSEGVVDRVDAASELAYDTFSRPVIKAMAVGAGTRQAVRRLRSRDAAGPDRPEHR
jgi:hypothetical protein